MKKLFTLFVLMFAVFCLAACGDDPAEKGGYDYDAIPDTMESADGKYEIAFVTDIGQLKDKSFNQGTWEGVKRFAKENEKSYKYYQPANANNATDEDRIAAFEQAINNGAKIVVAAGFMQANALYGVTDEKTGDVILEGVASKYPDVKFVFIDGWAQGFENVAAVIFQEEQAGYLAGYAAVMEGYTNLGFSGGGGGTNPACQRFGYGFVQGANDAAKAKGINVKMKYSWLHGSTFSASAELQAMLNGWYETGTEVVFSCGGSMCTSAFGAAAANQGKVIGVDVDQSGDSPTVITSATKGLREGTMYALEKFYANKWAEIGNKDVNLGAKDNAVGLPTDTWSMTKFTKEDYEKLFNDIKEGKVVVDAKVEGAETKSYSNVTMDYIQ